MQLSQFNTLEDAKEHSEQKERMISHDMIVVFLTKNQCITSLQNSTDESAKGFWLAVSSGVQEFNIMSSHPVGQGNQQLLTHMVSIGATNQSFADDCLSYANFITHPYAKATTHEFMKAKGTCPVKAVEPINGWLKITLTQDVEAHRPQVYTTIQGVRQHITTFGVIGAAGDYLAQVPRGYTELLIDDAYGAIA